jgi:glycosyltransferase involved in cell wall biosynthesis
MQKVLVITYYWPPGSGAGVQRWLKFSKYLPSYGWEPVILTVEPEFASYPAIDTTLEKDIAEGSRVYKTKATDYFRLYKKDKSKIPSAGFANTDNSGFLTKVMRFVRGNFFIPDPRKGWNKYAFRKACEIIESEKIDYVITTSPPHSTQLIGLKLKKRFPAIKWIADLRDPWTDIYYYSMFYHTCLAKAIDRRFEKNVLLHADRIITVGKSLKDILSGKAEGLSGKTEVITNGYDEDDFAGLESVTPRDFTVSYIGTLSEDYPLEGFLKAVVSLRQKGETVKLRFVGSVSPGRKELILSSIPEKDVEFISYVNHNSAIRFMKESSVLLLIIPDHLSAKSILTGKLFEYVASGNPVICLGPPDGDAAEILTASGSGKTFSYNESLKMEEFLRLIANGRFTTVAGNVTGFSRHALTGELVRLLKEI